jgi:hypothetical protein
MYLHWGIDDIEIHKGAFGALYFKQIFKGRLVALKYFWRCVAIGNENTDTNNAGSAPHSNKPKHVARQRSAMQQETIYDYAMQYNSRWIGMGTMG